MNLLELRTKVNEAIESAKEYDEAPDDIIVTIQIEAPEFSIWADDIELHYDNNCQASGCVVVGNCEKKQIEPYKGE
jgi:hypothetical protein